jgi:hypothetical protein
MTVSKFRGGAMTRRVRPVASPQPLGVDRARTTIYRAQVFSICAGAGWPLALEGRG